MSCDDKASTSSNQIDSISNSDEIDSSQWKDRLINEVISDSTEISNTDFSNVSGLNNERIEYLIDLLETYKLYNPFNVYEIEFLKSNKRTKQTVLNLHNKCESLLSKNESKYRSAFAKNLGESLWDQDIYVSTSGNKNTVLNITGGIFAANRNIKDFQSIIKYDAESLGFKMIKYRWYKGSSEYTYYKLNNIW
jgi:hypothetical protein